MIKNEQNQLNLKKKFKLAWIPFSSMILKSYTVMIEDPLSLDSWGNNSGFMAQGKGPKPMEKATI